MQEDLRWASHWVPTHPQDTGPCVVGPVSAAASQERMSHRTMKHCTHTLLLRFLTQWRSSRPSPPPTCPFREVFIAELRTLFPLHLALHSFAKQSIRRREQDPQDKTPLYCSQVSFSALAGDDLLSGPQVSQENTWIPGIPLSSQTGGKILDPGSLLLSPPPQGDG